MTKDMLIPRLFDVPERKNPGGRLVTATINSKTVRAMVSALESVGFFVRQENKGYTCMVNGVEVLNAQKGNRNTYLVRYTEGVMRLVEKQK